MKALTLPFLPLALGVLILAGCAKSPAYHYVNAPPPMEPSLGGNLFGSDTAVLGDDAVRRILDAKFQTRDSLRVAVHKLEGGRGGGLMKYYSSYWRDEEYMEIQQRYFDAVKGRLTAVKGVARVQQLPDILTPRNLTIPLLREAAVRLQADVLVIYSLRSETFEKVRVFNPNKLKAYGTCELVMLDVRTGIVPFSAIATRKVETEKGEGDISETEARKRAENEAVTAALEDVASQMGAYLAAH